MPIRRGISHVPPQPGTRPIRVKATMKRALVDATRRSQAQAMSKPAPTASPLTIAITGFSIPLSPRISRCVCLKPRRACSAERCGASPEARDAIPPMSAPAQKARPAPVSTTQRTLSSSPSSCTMSPSWAVIPPVSALSRSGRFNVSQATPFRVSERIASCSVVIRVSPLRSLLAVAGALIALHVRSTVRHVSGAPARSGAAAPVMHLNGGGAPSPLEGVRHLALVPLRVAERVEERARHLGVLDQAVFIRGADAGVYLVRRVARLQVRLAGHGLRHVNAGSGGTAAVQLPERLIGRPAGAVQVVHQPDDVILHALELADRHAELDARLAVGDGHVEDSLTATYLIGAKDRRRLLQRPAERRPTRILHVPQQFPGGDAHVFEP